MAGDGHLPKLTGPEHMAEGHRLLAESDDETVNLGILCAAQATAHFAAAQVHATLALAKALAAKEDGTPTHLQGWE